MIAYERVPMKNLYAQIVALILCVFVLQTQASPDPSAVTSKRDAVFRIWVPAGTVVKFEDVVGTDKKRIAKLVTEMGTWDKNKYLARANYPGMYLIASQIKKCLADHGATLEDNGFLKILNSCVVVRSLLSHSGTAFMVNSKKTIATTLQNLVPFLAERETYDIADLPSIQKFQSVNVPILLVSENGDLAYGPETGPASLAPGIDAFIDVVTHAHDFVYLFLAKSLSLDAEPLSFGGMRLNADDTLWGLHYYIKNGAKNPKMTLNIEEGQLSAQEGPVAIIHPKDNSIHDRQGASGGVWLSRHGYIMAVSWGSFAHKSAVMALPAESHLSNLLLNKTIATQNFDREKAIRLLDSGDIQSATEAAPQAQAATKAPQGQSTTEAAPTGGGGDAGGWQLLNKTQAMTSNGARKIFVVCNQNNYLSGFLQLGEDFQSIGNSKVSVTVTIDNAEPLRLMGVSLTTTANTVEEQGAWLGLNKALANRFMTARQLQFSVTRNENGHALGLSSQYLFSAAGSAEILRQLSCAP